SPVVPAGRRISRCRHRVEPRARHRAGLVRPHARLARPASDAAPGSDPGGDHPLTGADDRRADRRAHAGRGAHRRPHRPARAAHRRHRLLRGGGALGHLHGPHLPHAAGRAADAAGCLPRRLHVDRVHARSAAPRLAVRGGLLEPGHPRPRVRAPGDRVGHRARSRTHDSGPARPRRHDRRTRCSRPRRTAGHGPL
ncbi:MAG: hypothetical protein AVDCRST_MAG69-275, partial [uncultured Solirubrobacteraceae bacterium]